MPPDAYGKLLRLIARNVRGRRSAFGISQEEADHRANLSVRQWQRIEAANGIALLTLVKAASGLKSEITDLIRR